MRYWVLVEMVRARTVRRLKQTLKGILHEEDGITEFLVLWCAGVLSEQEKACRLASQV